jgi:SAM-dependent methyltransferase
MATATPTLDEARLGAFMERALGDASSLMATVLAALGDRLGLFRALALGPLTGAELAARTGTDERYVREWAAGLFAAGYLTHDPVEGRYTLPAAHVPTAAAEPGPAFFGGVWQELLGAVQRYDGVLEAFRTGGGVDADHLHPDVFAGTARFTTQWHENMLVPLWLPLLPGVQAALEAGATVADVGCGAGLAAVVLAREFPRATIVGYDEHAPSIAHARERAATAGVADRVRFEVLDASQGLPERYDVITTFDVVHDAVDPVALLRAIHDALTPHGTYVCLDINCSERTEDNVGPIPTLLYGFSLLYCMTTSLARGGRGLGTLGLPERVLRELAGTAGFRTVRRVEMDNPFNNLYELHR